MRTNFEIIRANLETRLKEATTNKMPGDSIRIQRVADPVDMTQEASDRDLAVQLLDRESALLRHLRSALDRIEDGSYGVCLHCEEEIAPTRLKAIPWAELCIRCQEQAEGFTTQRERAESLERRAKAA